jgi:hypothetical protein
MERSKLKMRDSVSASNLTLPKSRSFVGAKNLMPPLSGWGHHVLASACLQPACIIQLRSRSHRTRKYGNLPLR